MTCEQTVQSICLMIVCGFMLVKLKFGRSKLLLMRPMRQSMCQAQHLRKNHRP